MHPIPATSAMLAECRLSGCQRGAVETLKSDKPNPQTGPSGLRPSPLLAALLPRWSYSRPRSGLAFFRSPPRLIPLPHNRWVDKVRLAVFCG
jgi:hypothetical protein